MADSLTDLEAELVELRARRKTIAGIKSTSFGDQSTGFDGADLDKAIASLEARINTLRRGTSSRYAATTKGM